MAWNRWKRECYHPNYPYQASFCKERAAWQCESCGRAQGAVRINSKGIPVRIFLTASHDNHDPENPFPALTCLCQFCHGMYGTPHMIRVRKRNRIQRQIEHGQLLLFA